MSTSSSTPAPVPRPSASVAIVNARNEILLVHRNPKARSFGGMTVGVFVHDTRIKSMNGDLIH
jgi:hypothetical protein